MILNNSSEEETSHQIEDEIEEGEIDLSSLTSEEKDALILEMQAEEMMEKQRKLKEEEQPVKRKKKRKKKAPQNTNPAPGFGWVVIKMSTAMTFSMVFILIGPILSIFSIVKLFQTEWSLDWNALYFSGYIIFIFVGIGMVVVSWYLFRYIIRD